jgi:acyl-coenzyme A synthetase/AMP-(fatty) acid ligase
VIRRAAALRNDGVRAGDVVAGYLPNLAQTVMAMLACAAIGAVWCSCATDIGAAAAVDRIGQVNLIDGTSASITGIEASALANRLYRTRKKLYKKLQ